MKKSPTPRPAPCCPLCGGTMPTAPKTGASHKQRHRVCLDCEAVAWRGDEVPTGGSGPGIACTFCDDPAARMHVVAKVAGAEVRACPHCRAVHLMPALG